MPFQGTHFFGATPFYNGIATQSLRFDDGGSAYLSRTFSSDVDNDKKMTISVWVKRGNISNATQVIVSNYTGVRFLGELSWRSDDKIVFRPGGLGDGSSNSYSVQTTAQFRDPHSWYHLVLAYDSTQSTDTDRVELYVNGTEQTLEPLSGSHTFPPINYAHEFSYNGANNAIGYYTNFDSNYLDGYISEFNFIDGLTLDQNSFGETKNGVWIAKKYTGSYGTNGYRLEFKNTSVGSGSSSTIGADTSGNDHHWTSTNVTASDCNMPDSPENNFATWSPLFTGGEQSANTTGVTLSEGNLQVSVPTNEFVGSTFRPTSGKWYVEIRVKTIGSTNGEIDWGWIQATTYSGTSGHSGQANKWGVYYHAYSTDHIRLYDETSQLGSNINLTISAGNILQLAWDIDNGKGWVGINNTYYAADNGTDGNPSAGTNQTFDFTADEAQNLQVYVANGTGTDVHTINFGQDSTFGGAVSAGGNADARGIGDFAYAVPTGFLACCSSNLSDTTIGPNSASQSDDFFNSVLWTGNASTRSITGVGFQPDLVWIKPRSDTDNHVLLDTPRGGTKYLMSNRNDGQISQDPGITSFDTDGFSIGNWTNVNQNTETYVAWSWIAGGAPSADNSAGAGNTPTANSVKIDGSNLGSALAGTIPATRLTANTTSGFSIVTYTGTGTQSDTVAHGLGKAPKWYMTKSLSEAQNWHVYHEEIDASAPENYILPLNAQNAKSSSSANFWNSTAPTTSVVSVGDDNSSNKSSTTYVMYCYAEIDGFSKFGKHEGNNSSSDGQFIFTGFRPAWLMVKNIDTAGEDWHIFDNKRAPSNVMKARLIANENTQENTNDNIIDFVSNGFKWRDNNAGYNSSATFIYFAFAETPFKYANAR